MQASQYDISFAKYKLFELEIPMQLRATSYLRICCSAMRKSHAPELTQHLSSGKGRVETSYLELLRLLADRDPQWWNLCYVSYEGFLKSNDVIISQYLQPLNYFVQMQLSEFSTVNAAPEVPAPDALSVKTAIAA